MKAFPVIRVIPHHFSGEKQVPTHVTMVNCCSEADAIAGYDPRPGETVEFGWWVVANLEAYIPAY